MNTKDFSHLFKTGLFHPQCESFNVLTSKQSVVTIICITQQPQKFRCRQIRTRKLKTKEKYQNHLYEGLNKGNFAYIISLIIRTTLKVVLFYS